MNSNWKACTLGDLCSSVSDTYGLNASQVVLLNTSDIFDGKIINHSLVPRVNLKGQFKKTFKENDILYSEIRPKNKRYAFVDINDTKDYIASTKLMVIRPDVSKVEPKYLYYLLTVNSTLNKFQQLAESRSGTFPQITFDDTVAPYKVSIPSKDVQKAIIQLISDFDKKIDINKRIIDNLDECCMAYFNNKFFNLPKTKELKSFCSIVMGQSPEGSSLNADGDGAVFYQGCTDFGKHFPTRRLYTTNPKKLANKGDILVSVRAPVGRVNIANENCCIGRGLASIKSSYPTFCLFALYASSKEFAKYEADGTVFGSINKKGLESINIFNADEIAMSEFEQFSSPYVKMISYLDMENRLLANIRSTLLPKLLYGEIELKI